MLHYTHQLRYELPDCGTVSITRKIDNLNLNLNQRYVETPMK